MTSILNRISLAKEQTHKLQNEISDIKLKTSLILLEKMLDKFLEKHTQITRQTLDDIEMIKTFRTLNLNNALHQNETYQLVQNNLMCAKVEIMGKVIQVYRNPFNPSVPYSLKISE